MRLSMAEHLENTTGIMLVTWVPAAREGYSLDRLFMGDKFLGRRELYESKSPRGKTDHSRGA
jgi:hypothetical protein